MLVARRIISPSSMVEARGTASNSCWLHKISFTATAARASPHRNLALISRFKLIFIRMVPPHGAAHGRALHTVPVAARPAGKALCRAAFFAIIPFGPCPVQPCAASVHGWHPAGRWRDGP